MKAIVATLLLVVVPWVLAEDDPFGEAFDSGFGEVDTQADAADSDWYRAHRLRIGGQWNLDHDAPEAGATDHRGLSSLTTAVNTRLEWRPSGRFDAALDATVIQDWVFTLKPEANWRDSYRDQQESRLQVTDAFVRYQTLDWAVSSGRQIISWGFNDVLSTQEPVNPPDLTRPGLNRLEDARRSRWVSEGRYYLSDWTVQGVIAHENRMARSPVFGSDFHPLPMAVDEHRPDSGFQNPDAHVGGVRISGLLLDADIAAFAWRGYNPTGHLLFSSSGVDRRYERLTTVGAGLSLPIADAVLKAELTGEGGLTYAPVNRVQQNGQAMRVSGPTGETERLSWTLGVDVSLPADSRLLIEHRTRYLPDYRPDMADSLGEEFGYQWALGGEHTTARDRLTLSATVLGFGGDWDGGRVIRLAADWAPSDQWRTEFGWIGYWGGDSARSQALEDNDRVFWQVEWLF